MPTDVMSRADATWLHAEQPTNHFVVTSLGLLSEPVNPANFKQMLSNRLELNPRLVQVVEESMVPFAPPRWVPAHDFNLDAHVHQVALPAPGGRAELEKFIGDLVGQPIDFGRPLWSVYLVDGPNGKGSIVTRFHHALGDGPAMVRMMLTLTDQTRSGWRNGAPSPSVPESFETDGLTGRARDALRVIRNIPLTPSAARYGVAAAGTFAKLTLMDKDHATSLRGHLGLVKQVAWTDPLSLDLVKKTARATGTTLNDVVMSAIAGALGTWLRTKGELTRGLRVRAMVPVNMRRDSHDMSGNGFSLVFVDLPVGVSSPMERLMRVKIEMDRIKGSLEPQVGWLMVQGLSLLTPQLERLTTQFYADKASLVVTNVIGPDHPVYIAGSKLRAMTFWEPESGGLGVGISIYTYAGQMTIGVVSDRNLVSQPSVIAAGFTSAFRKLARAAGV